MLGVLITRPQMGFLVLLVVACAFLGWGIFAFFRGDSYAEKLFNTTSSLFGLSSIVQLKISGWFDTVMAEFGDENKYPYGPPSYITRQIIDNPDYPIQTAIRNTLFFDAETGLRLGVFSLIVAIIAAWS